MVVVAGYLVAAAVAIAISGFAAGRQAVVERDRTVNLGETGGRLVTVLGGLAGFAVTGMVLLVTLGQDLPDASGISFTTLLTMFLVAYMGYVATSVLFANIAHPGPSTGFDVQGAAFAGAAISLYYTLVVGWLALIPLFETFGLIRMADLAGWLLTPAIVGGYWIVAQQLYRSGFASPRLTILIPLVTAVAMLVYASIVGWWGLRSPDSTLALAVTGLIMGSTAFALLALMPIVANQKRAAPALAAFGRFLILGYAQGAVVLVGFMLLAVLGLA